MERYLTEAFQRLSLLEDDFNFTQNPDVDDLKAFVDDDVEEIPEEDVIDVDAKTEEDLEDTYDGKVILECECCHSRIYKDIKDVIIDKETELANIKEECPVCNCTLGWTVIGKIEKFNPDDIPEETEEDEEESELDLRGAQEELADEDKPEEVEESLKENLTDFVEDDFSEKEVEEACKDLDECGLDESWVEVVWGQMDEEDPNSDPYNLAAVYGLGIKKLDKRDGLGYDETLYRFIGRKEDFERAMDDGYFYSVQMGESDCSDDLKESLKEGLTEDDDYDWSKAIVPQTNVTYTDLVDELKQYGIDIVKGSKNLIIDYIKEFYDLPGFGANYIANVIIKNSRNILKMIDESLNEDFKEVEIKSVDDLKKYGDNFYAVKDPRYFNQIIKNGKLFKTEKGFKYVSNNKKVKPQYFDNLGDYVKECFGEALQEDFKEVEIKTDDQKLEMTSDENGKVTVTTEPLDEEEILPPDDIDVEDVSIEGEEIAPLTDTDEEEIETNSEEAAEEEMAEEQPEEPEEAEEETTEEETEETPEEEESEEVEEVEEESFNGVAESFMKRIYHNVNNFKTTAVKESGDTLMIEGLITFNSGASKKTTFKFKPELLNNKQVRLLGLNETFSNRKNSFNVRGNIVGKKLVFESMRYNYVAKNKLNESIQVKGREVNKKK